MKILIDMNLTPLWREPLEIAGHQALHWSEVGKPDDEDETLMKWALANGYVVLTHDLDYGALLFMTGASGPSVIQLRSGDVSPEALAGVVLDALKEAAPEIESGALLTIYSNRHRLAILPLRREETSSQ